MLHQSQALSSKAMMRETVQARTLRLNDRCTPGEMTVTDFEISPTGLARGSTTLHSGRDDRDRFREGVNL